MQFITEYANRADDGAPYAGPTLIADSWLDAEALLEWVKGPNGESLTVSGRLIDRLPPEKHGDTISIVERK